MSAHEVVVGKDNAGATAYGPYDTIPESVGGTSLTSALRLLAQKGTCVLFASRGPAKARLIQRSSS